MLGEKEQNIIAAATQFADEIISPQAERWHKNRRIPDGIYRQAAEIGLCRLIVPASRGGLGLSVTAMASVMEVLASRCFATAFSLVVHNNLAGRIGRSAPTSLLTQVLGELMKGETIGAFLLTEPDVGSDATAITTRAEKCPKGWRITGRKAWVSNGAIADALSVYAQTEAGAGARGIGCFLVDANAAGVERQANYDLLGGHALATAGFDFTNVFIGEDSVLVPPGEAFRAAMQGIDLARINVAAMCCGMMQSALDIAVDYVNQRAAFGGHIGDFQGVQWMLADVATDLSAAHLLAFEAARACDADGSAPVASAHAKKFATKAALHRIADCMQVMGARGLSCEHALPRHFAAAKMAQFLDGATEIQNVVIARSLLGRKH